MSTTGRNKLIAAIVTSACFGLAAYPAQADDRRDPNNTCVALPEPFDDYLIYMAQGQYMDSPTPGPGSPFTNCGMGFCDGEYFHRVVMGRSSAEIARLEGEAAAFFLKRFGVDVMSAANNGRIVFRRYQVDPRAKLRAYARAGECVPDEGWVVFSGGWMIVVTDPAGYTLGGEWTGTHVPAGTMAVFGNYNIRKTDRRGRLRDTEVLFYRSTTALEPHGEGEAVLRCDMAYDAPEFPTGVHGTNQGVMALYKIASTGELKWNIRAILTFGPSLPRAGLGRP